jgi:hypothetical protein
MELHIQLPECVNRETLDPSLVKVSLSPDVGLPLKFPSTPAAPAGVVAIGALDVPGFEGTDELCDCGVPVVVCAEPLLEQALSRAAIAQPSGQAGTVSTGLGRSIGSQGRDAVS